MQPTHTPRKFIANREFTDREHAAALFLDAFDGSQPRDQYRVLNWYGVGGEGKTALSNKLMDLAPTAAQGPASGAKPRIGSARVDFEDDRLRRVDEALLSIRLQLA